LWDKTEKETDEFLLGEMFYESNYGILEINNTGLITLALKDKQGKILNKIVISL
jgi:hypothetical protein